MTDDHSDLRTEILLLIHAVDAAFETGNLTLAEDLDAAWKSALMI